MKISPKNLIARGFDMSRLNRNEVGDVGLATLHAEIARTLGVVSIGNDLALATGLTLKGAAVRNVVRACPVNVTYARAIAVWIGCGEWDLYPSRYNPPAPRQLTKMERFRIERRAFRHQFIKGPRAGQARAMAFALRAK